MRASRFQEEASEPSRVSRKLHGQGRRLYAIVATLATRLEDVGQRVDALAATAPRRREPKQCMLLF